MNIGFYSPLKSPTHEVPSGDREMARALWQLLEGMGHRVVEISRLRSFDRNGQPARQLRLREIAERCARRSLKRHRQLELLFTYHVYHKAPDWIGPKLQEALGIPYVIAEASIAGKQRQGPWQMGHDATIRAVGRADHVFAMTELDAEALRDFARSEDCVSILAPFVQLPQTTRRNRQKIATIRLLCVAMMRSDVKLQSYEFLAQSLTMLDDVNWHLSIVGSGPAENRVRDLFARFGQRVGFKGQLDRNELRREYFDADLFVWPGFREAYGMVYLEAQASGLPVVAIGEGGVAEVVQNGKTGLLIGSRAPDRYAQAIRTLAADPKLLTKISAQSRVYVEQNHSVDAARTVISRAFSHVGAA